MRDGILYQKRAGAAFYTQVTIASEYLFRGVPYVALDSKGNSCPWTMSRAQFDREWEPVPPRVSMTLAVEVEWRTPMVGELTWEGMPNGEHQFYRVLMPRQTDSRSWVVVVKPDDADHS